MKRTFLLIAALLLSCSVALAQSAGYDLFQTDTSCSTSVDLSGVPGISPTVVTLQGVPIQTVTGNTDTIISRPAVVNGTTNPSVYALKMKNCGTVTLNGQPIDVYITVNGSNGGIATSVVPQPDSLQPSTGTMNVHSDGTFDSTLTVNADVIFTSVGGDPSTSTNHRAAPQTTLSSTGTWSATPPAGYPQSSSYPSGGFNPTHITHTAPGHLHNVIPASCSSSPASPTTSPTTTTQAKTGISPATPTATGATVARLCVAAVAAQ